MITFEDDVLQMTNALPRENWPGTTPDAGAPRDSALLATLESRLHCRTPMKRMECGELSMDEPVRTGGHTTAGPEKHQGPAAVTTYRCMCGFTMDVPARALEYAVAN